ncbi:MAG: Gfo/Idh/MocA family oxidoreductase [Clostridia bacterium]|nr:Gfo/Idh/MocA family oxidoreductase [Clostridia bacterium]
MIKVGVLGFAHGHVMSYGGEWNANDRYDVRIVAGWDHDAERLGKSCETLGAVPCATIDELLSMVDAVVISSETHLHAELVEKAAAAGKDIICYKPLALTMQEADRIVDAVNKNGVRFSMGWQMRTDAQNIRMKEMIVKEELGKVCAFRRRHGLATHTWANFENTWHVAPEKNRDIFADDSAHPINMMQWIFGMPETVSCEMSTMLNPKIPNDNGIALFKYANGMVAEITCCFTCSAVEATTEVYCEKGSIQQAYGDAPATRLPRVSGAPGLKWFREGDSDWTDSGIPSPAVHGQRLKDQAGPLADFLKGGPSVCTAEEGRDTLRLVLACCLSAREGKRVSVRDDGVYNI